MWGPTFFSGGVHLFPGGSIANSYGNLVNVLFSRGYVRTLCLPSESAYENQQRKLVPKLKGSVQQITLSPVFMIWKKSRNLIYSQNL